MKGKRRPMGAGGVASNKSRGNEKSAHPGRIATPLLEAFGPSSNGEVSSQFIPALRGTCKEPPGLARI